MTLPLAYICGNEGPEGSATGWGSPRYWRQGLASDSQPSAPHLPPTADSELRDSLYCDPAREWWVAQRSLNLPSLSLPKVT